MAGKGTFRGIAALAVLASVCVLAGPQPLPPYKRPASVPPPGAEGVRIDENLGRLMDLRLTFRDEEGKIVPLSDFFHKGRPVLLDLVYYDCPMLCNLILNGQTQVMREIPWTPGAEYEVVTISFNPAETTQLAREKKAVHLNSYGKPAPGWHFLTDHDGNAKRLAELIGFHYRYDQRQKQFAHPSAIMILTPEGKVARYLYGVRYKARDVRFALAEASENRMTMALDKIMLLCYQYDPESNSYVMFARNFMRFGGFLTVLFIVGFILKMVHEERNKAALSPAGAGLRKEGF